MPKNVCVGGASLLLTGTNSNSLCFKVRLVWTTFFLYLGDVSVLFVDEFAVMRCVEDIHKVLDKIQSLSCELNPVVLVSRTLYDISCMVSLFCLNLWLVWLNLPLPWACFGEPLHISSTDCTSVSFSFGKWWPHPSGIRTEVLQVLAVNQSLHLSLSKIKFFIS